jgi:hypothetical protein
MADPVWVDGTTPLNSLNMTKLQTRDEKAAANGYASLDPTGKVPAAQLPAAGVFLPAGTVFPASPLDGQMYVYAADATNGVYWAFVWNQAAGKWRFVGGPPLTAFVAIQETSTATTYGDLTTLGPSIVLPFAGDYDIGVQFQGQAQPGDSARIAYQIGATAPTDVDAAIVAPYGQGYPAVIAGMVSPAGAILNGSGFTVAYDGTGVYTVTFGTAFPSAMPVVTPAAQGAVLSASMQSSTVMRVAGTTPSAYMATGFSFAIFNTVQASVVATETALAWSRKLAISGTVTVKYRTSVGGLSYFKNRWLYAIPVQK